MSEKDNGGPAFPGQVQTSVQTVTGIHGYGASHDVPDRTFPVYSPTPGMTMRDWFAGMALSGLATLYAVAGGLSEDIAKANATVSYLMADAMIAERNK